MKYNCKHLKNIGVNDPSIILVSFLCLQWPRLEALTSNNICASVPTSEWIRKVDNFNYFRCSIFLDVLTFDGLISSCTFTLTNSIQEKFQNTEASLLLGSALDRCWEGKVLFLPAKSMKTKKDVFSAAN